MAGAKQTHYEDGGNVYFTKKDKGCVESQGSDEKW